MPCRRRRCGAGSRRRSPQAPHTAIQKGSPRPDSPEPVTICRPRHPYNGAPVTVIGLRNTGIRGQKVKLRLPDGTMCWLPLSWTSLGAAPADGPRLAGTLSDFVALRNLLCILGPVGRSGEQPRHRRRRHFHGRRRAVAGPAPARSADHALVGLDLDLDEAGFLGAVRRIGLSAPCADARIGRRVALFGALLEPGPLGTAMAGRAALLAARTPRARRLLLLALAPVERLRQQRPGRAKPRKLGLQRLDSVPRRLRTLAQPGVLPGKGLDRRLLASRSPQRPARLCAAGRSPCAAR